MTKKDDHDGFVLRRGDDGRTTVYRPVTRQGAVIEVRNMIKKEKHGGGPRKKKHGHHPTAERSMRKYLLRCIPADYVAWLTFRYLTGPKAALEMAKKLIKLMQKEFGQKIPAVIKLEVQPARLCAEISILLWKTQPNDLHVTVVEELWNKVQKTDMSVILMKEVEIGEWVNLVNYISKRVYFTDYGTIVCGHMETPIPSSLNARDIADITYLVNSTQSSVKNKQAFAKWVLSANPEICWEGIGSIGPIEIANVWKAYTGHFQSKHRRKEIPLHPVIKANITMHEVDTMRQHVNHWRQNHFVGTAQGFTLMGRDTMEVIEKIPVLKGPEG